MFDESVRTLLTQHDKLQYTLIVFGNVANTPRSPFCFVSELYIVVRFNNGRRKKIQRKMDVDSSSTVAKVLTIGCLVFSLVGVVLNIIVLAVVRQIRSMHTVTNYLLANVALANLLTLIWPSNIGSLRVLGPNMDNATGNFLCKFIDFFPLVTMSVSALTLTTLAVERYQGLVKPLSSRFKLTRTSALFAIFVVWIVALAFLTPFLLFTNFNKEKEKCQHNFASTAGAVCVVIFTIVTVVVPCVTITFGYFRIIKGCTSRMKFLMHAQPTISHRRMPG